MDRNNLYEDKNYYFLTVGTVAGIRTSTAQNLGTGYPVINVYDDFGYYETEKYNILKSGRDWFGEQFSESVDITVRFDIAGIVDNSTIKMVSAVMAQAYEATSSFKIYFNNSPVAEQILDPVSNTQYALKGSELTDTLLLNSNTVSAPGRTSQDIKYQYVKASSGTSIGYLNHFLISLKRKLALYGDQTIFTSAQSLANPVSTFEIASLPQNAMILLF